MDGKTIVARLKKLRDVETIREVKTLTAAMFPGPHCPLMGAAMAVRGIRDGVILVLGTEECAYYTKDMTIHSGEFGGLAGRCVSVVLDKGDVTFGFREKAEAAFGELMAEYGPRAVFLTTTCVVEIIGEDVDALAARMTEKWGIPVMAVHTEHFKCENHIPGLARTISACFDIMESRPPDGSVNVLGQRMGDFSKTELSRVLGEAGARVGLRLPSGCSVEEIKGAAAAKVNVVVNEIALPLARRMEAEFGIPWVFFDRFVSPENIMAAYERLFAALALPLPDQLRGLYAAARKARDGAARALSGVKYIYGNTPLRTFEFNRLLVELGMIPALIQTSSLEPEDRADIAAILEKSDPYVTKTANIAPLQFVYDELQPDVYLGHEFAARLRKKGIAIAHTDRASGMLGFEVTGFVLGALAAAAREAKEYRKEVFAS